MRSLPHSVRLLCFLSGAVLAAVSASAQLSLTPAPQVLNRNTSGFSGDPESEEALGAALASGDFNSDGFNDLAIGAPGTDIGGISSAGAVFVLYGTANGLVTANMQTWAQNSPGIEDQAEENDQFGRTLAAGDFNGDGFDDLAIGVPLENVGIVADAGALHVIHGAPGGLNATGSQFWHQDSSGIAGAAQTNDQFGFSLVAGDFNGDGFDELAVGIPREDVASVGDAGAVSVIYGSAAGLASANNQFWNQNVAGIENDAEQSDLFGLFVTAGDFNNDGFDDLAVAAPGQDVGSDESAGAVHIIFGSMDRLTGEGSRFFTQDTSGIADVTDSDDNFGAGLAAGDFDGDGFDDIAIGARGEEVEDEPGAGAIHVLFGSSAGITTANNQFWSLDSTDVPGSPTPEDRMGGVLAVHDFDNDGFDDLVAGVPRGDVGDIEDAGFLLVLYGRPGGLTSAGSRLWTTDDLGFLSNATDNFGWSLAAGDFNGDGFDDAAAGSPGDDIGTEQNAGTASVIYGNRPSATVDNLQRMLRGLRQQNGRLGQLEEQLP